MDWDDWSDWRDDFFEPSRPLEARGGIKARTKRGAFGSSWWAGRWSAVLEGFQLGGRLARGRTYARRGQVLDVSIEKGRVHARVQGSRPAPYSVTIGVKVLSPNQWARVARALCREARLVAKLLASEMPEDIETAFRGASLSLFPERRNDLRTECSCPDWSNPCKHIAAVFYLLGEEFDRDPFLIFKLRGAEREELVRSLGAPGESEPRKSEIGPPEEKTPPVAREPLKVDTGLFWTGDLLPEALFGEVQVPTAAAALPRRLGAFPFWRGSRPLLEAIEPAYTLAAPAGLEAFLGLRGGTERPPAVPRGHPLRKPEAGPIPVRSTNPPSARARLNLK